MNKMTEYNNIDEDISFKLFSKSLYNSVRLMQDANLLFQNKSYGHAFAFVVFAIEELGKSILASWGEFDIYDPQNLLFNKDIFTDHLLKQEIAFGWLINLFFMAGLKNTNFKNEIVKYLAKCEKKEISKDYFKKKLIELLDKENTHATRLLKIAIRDLDKYNQNPKGLHQKRMRSLYTELEKNKIYSPDDFIRQDVEGLLKIWELFINDFYKMNNLLEFRKKHFILNKHKSEEIEIIRRIFKVLGVKYYRITEKVQKRNTKK